MHEKPINRLDGLLDHVTCSPSSSAWRACAETLVTSELVSLRLGLGRESSWQIELSMHFILLRLIYRDRLACVPVSELMKCIWSVFMQSAFYGSMSADDQWMSDSLWVQKGLFFMHLVTLCFVACLHITKTYCTYTYYIFMVTELCFV